MLALVAVGGYFFVYPRLRGGEAQTATVAQVSQASQESPASTATGNTSASAPAESPVWQTDPAPPSPAANDGLQATANPAEDIGVQKTSSENKWSRNTSAADSRPSSHPGAKESDSVTERPQPVVSLPLGGGDQGRPVSEAQDEPIAPITSSVPDRTPSPSDETEPDQATADRQPDVRKKPAYDGPKRGVVVWTGEVDKGTTVVIEGSAASIGRVQGALPGVACIVRMGAPNVAVAEGPGPRNSYRRISLRFNKKGRFSVPVEWEVLD